MALRAEAGHPERGENGALPFAAAPPLLAAVAVLISFTATRTALSADVT